MSLLLVALLIYFGFFFYVMHCVVLFDFPSVFFKFFAGHDWDVGEHGLDLGIPLLILLICSGMLLPQVHLALLELFSLLALLELLRQLPLVAL